MIKGTGYQNWQK